MLHKYKYYILFVLINYFLLPQLYCESTGLSRGLRLEHARLPKEDLLHLRWRHRRHDEVAGDANVQQEEVGSVAFGWPQRWARDPKGQRFRRQVLRLRAKGWLGHRWRGREKEPQGLGEDVFIWFHLHDLLIN